MPDGRLFVTQHGRDQLSENWPDLYKLRTAGAARGSHAAAKSGADYGWPECYFEGFQRKLVLAPSRRRRGQTFGFCAQRSPPAAFFPATGLRMTSVCDQPQFRRPGAKVPSSLSWFVESRSARRVANNVVFQPMAAAKRLRVRGIADGFAGP